MSDRRSRGRGRTRRRGRSPGVAALAALAGLVVGAGLVPVPLAAQGGGAPAVGPAADAGEAGFRTTFQLTDRPERPPGSDYGGANLEAEVILGHRFGLLGLGSVPAGRLELGLEVGIESRFFLETRARDLIHADYRVGVPVTLAGDRWHGRLTLVHASSHLGDDFVRRFRLTTRRQVSRDGLELVVGRRLSSSLDAYAGATWNVRVTPRVERTAARWGLAWRPGRDADASAGVRPYAAADFRVTSTTGTGVATTGVAGLAFRPAGLVISLEARGHVGLSTMGWFRNDEERSLGLGLRIEP